MEGLIALALLIAVGLPLASIISLVLGFIARGRLDAIEIRLASPAAMQRIEARLRAVSTPYESKRDSQVSANKIL